MIFRKLLILCDQNILEDLQHSLDIFLNALVFAFYHHFLLDNGNFIGSQVLYSIFKGFSGFFQRYLSLIIGGFNFMDNF